MNSNKQTSIQFQSALAQSSKSQSVLTNEQLDQIVGGRILGGTIIDLGDTHDIVWS